MILENAVPQLNENPQGMPLKERLLCEGDSHHTVEELVTYCRGEMAAEQEEAVRDHVSLCGECLQTLLDLIAFLDVGSNATDLPRDERYAVWKKVQRTAS